MFSQLNEYVKELPKKMKIIDRKVFNDKQVSIHWETFGNIATAALHIAASKVPFIPGLQPGASLIIFYVGAEIIGLGVRTLGDHWHTKSLKETVKLHNINTTLNMLSSEIDKERYKGNNFFFVSINNDIDNHAVIAQFAKKDMQEEANYSYIPEVKKV